jgi:hypothetical protein
MQFFCSRDITRVSSTKDTKQRKMESLKNTINDKVENVAGLI